MNKIQLFNQDCIEGMQTLADNSVDCIIADPPYVISRDTNFHTMGRRGAQWILGSGIVTSTWSVLSKSCLAL